MSEPKTFRMLNVSSKFAICGLPVRVDTYRRERVVRCLDCEFYEGGGCTLLDFSATDMDLGFCKWAVPRDKE